MNAMVLDLSGGDGPELTMFMDRGRLQLRLLDHQQGEGCCLDLSEDETVEVVSGIAEMWERTQKYLPREAE